MRGFLGGILCFGFVCLFGAAFEDTNIAFEDMRVKRKADPVRSPPLFGVAFGLVRIG